MQNGGARLSAHIYDQLKTRLLDGLYQGGEKLSVDAIRSEFDVSKQPVMDALRNLAADGLVEIIPQVGCAVRSYSREEIYDFYLLLAGTEETVSGMAAERRSPEQLRQLRDAYERMSGLADKYPEDELPSRYRIGNREFHEIIHRMADSSIITSFSKRGWDLSDYLVHCVGATGMFRNTLSERQHDHGEILAALEAGDADKARQVAKAHMLHTGKLILDAAPIE